MIYGRIENTKLNIKLRVEIHQHVNEFMYQCSKISKGGRSEKDIIRRINIVFN